MHHVLTDEEVGLAVDETGEEHFDGVFVLNHVVLHAMEDYTRAFYFLDNFNVVESFFKEYVGDFAAEIAGNVEYRFYWTD